jgi:DegV family protein with EDD domain
MQIVTDSGTDINFSPSELKEFNVHIVPLSVTLNGRSFKEGVDIQPNDFYPLMDVATELPVTSQPSAGEFATLYRELAKTDPDILSLHISSGLSGTAASARAAADMVPEARVTVVDCMTLSVPAGWQVEAAARAAKAGWPKEKILDLVQRISDATDVIYSLKELKYLIHGGRISHMKGLIASVLNIKPLIGVEKVKGTYVNLGQARSFAHAIKGLGDYVSRKVASGSHLRAQVVHAANPEGAQALMEEISGRFKCDWVPLRQLSLVLGAHVGRSMIGVAFAPAEVFDLVPQS